MDEEQATQKSPETNATRESLQDVLPTIRRFMSMKNFFFAGYAEILVSTTDIRVPLNTTREKPGTWLDLEDLDTATSKLEKFVSFLKELGITNCGVAVAFGYEDTVRKLVTDCGLVCDTVKVVPFTQPKELTEMVDPEHDNAKFVVSKLSYVFSQIGEVDDRGRVFGSRRICADDDTSPCHYVPVGPVIANAIEFGLEDRLIITVASSDGFVDDNSPTDETTMIDLRHRQLSIENSCLNIIQKHNEGFFPRMTALVRGVEAAVSLQERHPWIKLTNISTKGLCLERLIREQTCLSHSLDDLDFRTRVAKRVEGKAQMKNVYVIGETGQGKSCTLRALCGDQVEVIQNEPTANIESYISACNTVMYHDTPGLNDEKGRDRRIIAYLVAHVADKMTASSILYVRKDWSRLPKSEQIALRNYWHVFGEKLRDMIIIVVTSKRNTKVEQDVRNQLSKMSRYIGSVPSERIVYLGSDADKAVLDRRDLPANDLSALERLIANDTPRNTVNADVLEELLEDGSEFWKNRELVLRQRDMLADTLPWFPGFVEGALTHSKDKWMASRRFTGPVGLMNFAFNVLSIQTQLGTYDVTDLTVAIEMAGELSAKAVRKATTMDNVIEQVNGRGGLLVHLVVTSEVKDRTRSIRRNYVAVCPGEKLTKELKDRILVILYNEKAYAELVRAAQAECPEHSQGLHHI